MHQPGTTNFEALNNPNFCLYRYILFLKEVPALFSNQTQDLWEGLAWPKGLCSQTFSRWDENARTYDKHTVEQRRSKTIVLNFSTQTRSSVLWATVSLFPESNLRTNSLDAEAAWENWEFPGNIPSSVSKSSWWQSWIPTLCQRSSTHELLLVVSGLSAIPKSARVINSAPIKSFHNKTQRCQSNTELLFITICISNNLGWSYIAFEMLLRSEKITKNGPWRPNLCILRSLCFMLLALAAPSFRQIPWPDTCEKCCLASLASRVKNVVLHVNSLQISANQVAVYMGTQFLKSVDSVACHQDRTVSAAALPLSI